MSVPTGELAQVRALTGAFFARFFESDTTSERTDPTQSFIWLVAVLAAPGLLLTFYRQFNWDRLARYRGEDALHLAARFDTSTYLALTFAAIGIVAAARWQSLMVDRRDALVLGVMPVAARTIVASKLVALAGYTLLLSVGMHLGSSLLYGLSLGGPQGLWASVRTLFGHFVAGVGLTAFVVTAVASVQAVGLLAVGPVRFARVSLLLQMALIASVLVVFALMPGRSPAAFTSLDQDGVAGPRWASWLPPVWFLGLYDSVAGSGSRELGALARTGVGALATTTFILLVSAPLAARRTLRAAVEGSAPAGEPVGRRLAAGAARLLARRPVNRAAIQFTLAAIGRVAAPRLVLAVACAVGLMGLVPVLVEVMSASRDTPTIAVLAFPFVMLYFWLLGLRLAIRSPVELQGRWLFDLVDLSPLAGRRAARRVLLLFGLMPPVLVTWVLGTWMWGPALGAARTLAALAGGLAALEVLLWGYVGVPCSRPAASAGFKGRSLALAVGFELFCFETAAAQARWPGDAGPVVAQAVFFLAVAVGVRIASERAARTNAVMDPNAEARLDLAVVGAVSPRVSPGHSTD
jgi:hypothetical protein